MQPEGPNWAQPITALVAVLLIAGGIALAAAVIDFKVDDAAKAERLRREGAPVAATLGHYHRSSRGQSSTVRVQYEYGGQILSTEVACDVRAQCDPERTTADLPIFVDRASPREVVTVLGDTDDSLRWLNHWNWLTPAVLLIAVGGLAGFIWFHKRRGTAV
ncbi:hypothetical protein [Actinoplanes sp. NBRC 101535]|uniref:DUF3592 domain-containing protein n=1 Tax=Actinoplanes sp. NBRC 101535 TaxID=3032196 RepID=UPI0024A5E6DF|nr:hypothetical protein [Actinoplanes sp. NBRC 101535]GLY06719.1 hypothetical protein Acsp01_70980 [Actinoplanes sp. NBRC 101535]